MSRAKLLSAAAFLLLVIVAPATADEVSFDFQAPGISLIGVFTTSDTLNVLDTFDVTAISGTLNGAPIGPLLPNPDQPFVFTDPSTGTFWDNDLSLTAPYVDFSGIGFNFKGDQLALFSGVTGDPFSEGLFDTNLKGSFIGTLHVPEPASWILLLVACWG